MRLLHYSVADSENTLVYVHIGKCGGSSLEAALKNSQSLKNKFSTIVRVHIEKPPILERSKYIIVIRNPISRAISAFNWRYKLVVKDESQRHRFPGEWEVLTKYKTLQNLATELYTNGKLNEPVAAEFRTIHHLKEDIAFYLSELLDTIQPHQIFATFATETLDRDMAEILNLTVSKRIHEHSLSVADFRKDLDQTALNNLKKFLTHDYDCVQRLLMMNHSTSCSREVLLD